MICVVIAFPMVNHGSQASTKREHERKVNLADMTTDLAKLLPGEKRGKAVSLVEVSSPQQQWLCRLSFVGLRIVSVEV